MLHLLSRERRVSARGLLTGLDPKGFFDEIFLPYGLPEEVPRHRLPDDGLSLRPLFGLRKGRAGSSPGITCWGID